MEQLKNYFKIFKELWTVPRYQALIKLGLYFIFFTFVIIGIRANYNYSGEVVNKTPQSKDSLNLDKYFDSIIKTNGIEYEHTKTEEIELIKIEDKYYSIKYNILTPYDIEQQQELEGETPDFIVKFWRFTPEVINTLVEAGSVEYTTNFTEGTKETGYIIPMRKVFETINSGLSLREGASIDETSLKIKVRKTGSKVESVTIDATAYKNLFVDNKTDELIAIEYK